MNILFSVLALLEERCFDRADHPALVEGKRLCSFADLRRRTYAGAQALRDLGVQEGDRVGVCMEKSIEQAVALLAILANGAIAVPILPALKHDNITHIVNDSGMSCIISDRQRLGEISAFSDQSRIVIGHGEVETAYPNLLYMSEHLVGSGIACRRLGVDLAMIIYSSGSTGRPKGIMVTHRNLVDVARIVSTYLCTTKEDRIAGILSLNFDYGLNQLWQTLLIGCTLCLHELVLPNDVIQFIEHQRITVLPLMPAIMSRLFDARLFNQNHGLDLSRVRYICTSGGRVSPEMIRHLKTHFPQADIYLMYGLTEAFRSTYLLPEQLEQRPNSIGKAIPDVEILVLDENGDECAPNQQGELVHRGGCITHGYWNDPEKTAERFRIHPLYPGEVLVYSGDVVTRDADGYLTFVARKDGMLKNMGIRISPTEIEAEAERHEEVGNAVVFGLENIEVGHDIVLCNTTVSGEPLNERMFRMFLKEHLPTHMIPRYFHHQRIFPVTGNRGKIDRVAVREMALAELGIEN